MGIRLLDGDTINKIAAGEVIERPASVVKELAENAIDAGASSLTVEIRDGGISLIRVTDNGCGIPAEEVRSAFLRHATSKIRTAEDLTGVRSLGFRGEALSSIAAVCRAEIITKTAAALTGTRYVIEGGEEKLFEEVGAPEGTTVIARDLFFHTPVRRKFLKTPATEGAHVSELAEQLALSHPEVALRFIVNGQSRFGTSGNGSLKDIIYQLYGREIAGNLIELDAADGPLAVRGFIGKPELSRGSRAMEHYFVNGRYIKSKVISRALEDGFGNLMMQHSFPVCALSISVDPERVDVNVHPSKREVRFEDGHAVYSFLKEAVESALKRKELIRDTALPEPQELPGTMPSAPPVPSAPAREPQEGVLRRERPPEPFETRRIEAASLSPGADSLIRESAPEEDPRRGAVEKDGQLSLFAPGHREGVRLVGSVFDTYWIAEWSDALYLIDQHAAHEKVNYERLMASYKKREVSSQILLPPMVLTLTDREALLLEEQRELFSSLGYEIEHFGGHSYAVRAVPDILPSVMKDALLKTMIGSLTEESGEALPRLLMEKTASLSCKAAVKGNQRLSAGEAEALLDELFQLENPYNCPHGRPTVIRISRAELERRFKRTV